MRAVHSLKNLIRLRFLFKKAAQTLSHCRAFAMDVPVSQKVAGRSRLSSLSETLRRENGIAPFSTSSNQDRANTPQRTLGQQS